MDRSLVRSVARKYLPLYRSVQLSGAQALASCKQFAKFQQRAREDALRLAHLQRTRSLYKPLVHHASPHRTTSSSSPGFLTALRAKWAKNAAAAATPQQLLSAPKPAGVVEDREEEEDLLLAPPAKDEEEEAESEDKLPLLLQQQDEQKKKKKQARNGTTPATATATRPDPFTVSAPLYTDQFGSRMVCRNCDYTLSRGARGVHLFSWHSNNHLAINEEITDTLVFKPIEVSTERNQSRWKIAKAACPCCGTSVGSMGYTETSIKVLLKGVSVAWRKPVDVKQLQRPYFVLDQRPHALIFPSTWLYSQAGLMTHARRWVLDTHTLNRAVTNTKLMQGEERWKTATADANALLRAMESEPKQVNRTMAVLVARAMALEAIGSGAIPPSALLEHVFGCLEQIANRMDRCNSEDGSEEEERAALETSLVLVRATCLAKLAVLGEDELVQRSELATLLAHECKLDVMENGPAIALLPARTLCAMAKLLTGEHDALVQICNILAERRKRFGDTAGAFGRSLDYMKRALQGAGTFSKEEMAELLAACGAPHPSPGARFGGQLDANGFVELFCTHTDAGAACNRRATHVSPDIPLVRRIPTHCRTHAPSGFVAPGAVLLDRDAVVAVSPIMPANAPYPPPSSLRFGNRRPNAIVNVPDPDATTFGPAPPDTLFLGRRFQESIEFISTEEQLGNVLKYFDRHFAEANAAMLRTASAQVPSTDYAVGLDVEWKPEFFYHADNNVASICQVSTRSKHFVFDMLALREKLDGFFRELFANRAVIKIGHGLGEDLSRIALFLATCKHGKRAVDQEDGGMLTMQQAEAKRFFPCQSVLELTPLYSKAEGKQYTGNAMPSLVAMVQAATGLKLDKSCQMTDWERRPLSPMQLRYASTDAACAFLLLDYFVSKINESGEEGGLDLSQYLTTDEGNILPQRGETPPAVSTSFVMNASFGARTLLRPAVVAAAEAASASSASASASPTLSTTPSLSFLKRLQELKTDLESQGVRVDEHASHASLEIATEHLERRLDRVVRDTLVD